MVSCFFYQPEKRPVTSGTGPGVESLLKARIAKFLLLRTTVVWRYKDWSWSGSMINPCKYFSLILCVYCWWGQGVGEALETVETFSLIKGLRIEFLGININLSSRGSSLVQQSLMLPNLLLRRIQP